MFVLTWLCAAVLILGVHSQTCEENSWEFDRPNALGGISVDYTEQNAVLQEGTLNLLLNKALGGTRVSLNNKLQYGTVNAVMRASPGSNVVSSFILMAENGDEIDFEFVGKDPRVVQTNFFFKGQQVFNKNAKFYVVSKNLTATYNKFTIVWTPAYYEWKFNDVSLRKLYANETQSFPDSVSNIQFGIWEAPPSTWAGKGIDWNEGPKNISLKSVSISCLDKSNKTQPKPNNPSEKSCTPATHVSPFMLFICLMSLLS